jgi:hypothetical protein
MYSAERRRPTASRMNSTCAASWLHRHAWTFPSDGAGKQQDINAVRPLDPRCPRLLIQDPLTAKKPNGKVYDGVNSSARISQYAPRQWGRA